MYTLSRLALWRCCRVLSLAALAGLLSGACVESASGGGAQGASVPEDEVVEEALSPEDIPGEEPVAPGRSPVLPEARPLAFIGPKVAYGKGRYLVVWWDVREGGVYGARMKADGTLLDPEGIRINPGSGAEGARGTVVVGFDGENFMVVWERGDGISGVRVTPEGTVLGPVFDVIDSSEVSGPTGIACSREVCLVTFISFGDDGTAIRAVRIGTDGTVLDPLSFLLSRVSESTRDAQVAWSGKVFLAVWTDMHACPEGASDIYGARVKPDGTLLDLDGGFPISAARGTQRRPAVAWTGRRFLVVWSDGRNNGASGFDIYGARVSAEGGLDDPAGFPISTAPGLQDFPAVAHHGSRSLVVWQDARGGAGNEIWGARVTEDRKVLEPSGFNVSRGVYADEFRPAVAHGGGLFLVPYAAWTEPGGDFVPHFIAGRRVKEGGSVLEPVLLFTRSSSAPAAAGR